MLGHETSLCFSRRIQVRQQSLVSALEHSRHSPTDERNPET